MVQGEFLNSAQLTGKLAGSGKIENLIHEKYDISSAKLSQVSSMLILFNSGGLLTRIGPPGCSCRCLQIPPHNQFPLSLPESWPRKRENRLSLLSVLKKINCMKNEVNKQTTMLKMNK